MSAKKVAAVNFDFDKPPAGASYFRVRNITNQIVAIPAVPASDLDLFLTPHQEVSIPSDQWVRNRNLRNMHRLKHIELKWVDDLFTPRVLPVVTDAPIEFMPDSALDQNFAMQIAIETDLKTTLKNVNYDVQSGDTHETDVSFMKTRMHKILRTAEWLEKQVQNRKPVLDALKDRIAWIRSL